LHGFEIEDDLAAIRASERRNRHTPGALARETPIRPSLGHIANPFTGPWRHPVHLVDRVENPLAQLQMIDLEEPLLGRAKNQGILASPAVRVAVCVMARREQRATLAQVLDNTIVGLKYILSRPLARLGRKPALIIDWSVG